MAKQRPVGKREPLTAKAARENTVVQDFQQHKDEVPPTESIPPDENLESDDDVSAFQFMRGGAALFEGVEFEDISYLPIKLREGGTFTGVVMDWEEFTSDLYPDGKCNRYEMVDGHGIMRTFIGGVMFDSAIENAGVERGDIIRFCRLPQGTNLKGDKLNQWQIQRAKK